MKVPADQANYLICAGRVFKDTLTYFSLSLISCAAVKELGH